MFSTGAIDGMRCTRILELSDPNSWRDNYLCVPTDSPIFFSWSMAGSLPGKDCIQWTEPDQPASHTWGDNYLCADVFTLPRSCRIPRRCH